VKETCGLFIIHNGRFLIAHPTNGGISTWSIPKGLKDEGETYEQAAIRETFEETNIDITRYPGERRYVGQAIYPTKRKVLHAFVQVLPQLPSEELKCHTFVNGEFPECDDYRWVTYDEGMLLLPHATRVLLVRIKDKLEASESPYSTTGSENE